MVSIWFLRNWKDKFVWMEMMNGGRTEMELTNPHSCGPFMGQKVSVVMVSAADVWVRRWVFFFDAKWKFSFETRGRGLRLDCPVADNSRLLN